MNAHLSGLKILDFSYLLPGPYGTLMLADMGADIIKIENPANPDMTRLLDCPVDGVSAAYLYLNRGKRSLSLDLKKPGARDVVLRLLREYDIVVEQFRPGVMDRFGLGYEALRAIQPRLIYCSVTGYGQTGSYRDRPGHDINYLALSGSESYAGRAGAGPVPGSLQVADICAGSKNLAIGLLASVIRRMNTGEGEHVDISIADGSFALAALQAGALVDGCAPRPESEPLNGGSLYDFYRTADERYLSAGMLEPRFRANFLAALGVPEVEFSSMSADALAAQKRAVARVIASMPLAHWEKLFAGIEACVEPVRTLTEAADNPPFCEREMTVEVPTVEGTPVRQFGNPLKFSSGTGTASFAGAPMGHHNAEILRGAGYSDAEIEALGKSGILG
ncbi:MAG: CoA transferase [Spirochaetes bacterium]|nr:MAG: CoA transferase [Spirochaetota bacterium]